MSVKIEQVIGKLHEAEGLYNPSSHAMRGVLPDTLAWYYKYKGINKQVPIGKDNIGSFMKANVTEALATDVAKVKYFEPQGLDSLYYPEVASILLGIVYHLPSLANSVVGDSLSRLGSQKAIYSDFEKKVRARSPKIDATWLSELDTYSRRKGVVPVYNAVYDSINDLYLERDDTDDIENRLVRIWTRMDDGCDGTSTKPNNQGVWSNVGGGDTVVINNSNGQCNAYEPEELSFADKLGAKLAGWWRDLTGVRYVFREPGVLPDFLRALFILFLVLCLGFGIWYWWKMKTK